MTISEVIQVLIDNKYLIVFPSTGNVFRTRHLSRAKRIAGWPNRNGVLKTSLTLNGQTKYISVADIIWQFENGPVPEGYRVDAIDGNRKNLTIKNLYLKKGHNIQRGGSIE